MANNEKVENNKSVEEVKEEAKEVKKTTRKKTVKKEVDNLELYKKFKTVPEEAKKPIQGGPLGKAGYTDINPVWRIKVLTEQFGPCGIGWYSEITREWTEDGAAGEKVYFVKLKLYVKYDGEWSKGIEGTGGSKLINTFKGQLTSNDEALKMAETDALSVAMKKLGIAADVYYAKDRTKHDLEQDEPGQYKNNNNNKKQDDRPLHERANEAIGRNNNSQQQSTGNNQGNNNNQVDNRPVTQGQLKRYFAIAKGKDINIEWLDECIKVAFNLESKNDWKRSDYDAFTKYMDENEKEKTISLLEIKIKKQGKQVPAIENFQKAG